MRLHRGEVAQDLRGAAVRVEDFGKGYGVAQLARTVRARLALVRELRTDIHDLLERRREAGAHMSPNTPSVSPTVGIVAVSASA